MNENPPQSKECGIPLAAIARGRKFDEVLELYMTTRDRMKQIVSKLMQSEIVVHIDPLECSICYIYLAGVEDGMKKDKSQLSMLFSSQTETPVDGDDPQETRVLHAFAVDDLIDKGRDFTEVLNQYKMIWNKTEQTASKLEKSETEVPAGITMVSIYRIYLLGVQDGMCQ